MTFTTSFKEELSRIEDNNYEKRIMLISFLSISATIENNITITSETASVIRNIYSCIKEIYNISPIIKVRTQKRFKQKQIYILEINQKSEIIQEDISIKNLKTLYETTEDKIAYLKGAFLAGGSITDPKNSGYHLEFSSDSEEIAVIINNLLTNFDINSKIIKRANKNIIYIKASEEISTIFKMFKTINTLFYFEDIRIYRDHKNMVNRLTNCEIANQEKIITTGMKQIKSIEYLKENNLYDLLDDKTKSVMQARLDNADASLEELSQIISNNSTYKIGKSGINHNFIKVNKLIQKHKESIDTNN